MKLSIETRVLIYGGEDRSDKKLRSIVILTINLNILHPGRSCTLGDCAGGRMQVMMMVHMRGDKMMTMMMVEVGYGKKLQNCFLPTAALVASFRGCWRFGRGVFMFYFVVAVFHFHGQMHVFAGVARLSP